MSRILVLLAVIGLGGCASSFGAGLAGGPAGLVDYQTGVLQMRQNPDGQRGFAFAISDNAFQDTGTKPTPEDRRLNALANEIGQKSACPGAYKITSRNAIPNMILYEGVCL